VTINAYSLIGAGHCPQLSLFHHPDMQLLDPVLCPSLIIFTVIISPGNTTVHGIGQLIDIQYFDSLQFGNLI